MTGVTGLARELRAPDDFGSLRSFGLAATAAVLQALPVAILVVDPRRDEDPIVFANDAAVALTGYGGDALLGQNGAILMGAESDPAAVGRIRAAIAAAAPLELELRLHRKDGAGFWARVIVAPLAGEDGAVEHVVLTLIDITVERGCIDALEDHNRILTMMGEALARQNRELTKRCAALQHQNDGGRDTAPAPRSTH